MNYEDLLAYLQIDEAAEFKFFENMADLIESEEYIERDSIYRLFLDTDKSELTNLVDEYFEEVTNALPEDSDDIYQLMDQIRLCIIGLISSCEEEEDYIKLAEEFVRFRQWYIYDSQVYITSEEDDDEMTEVQSVCDSITTARIDAFHNEKHVYSYEDALDYEIDSYAMSFAELAAIGDEEDE